ncbi:MAG: hypothetical protein ACE5GW_06860 [Planctomycetota bacterium]
MFESENSLMVIMDREEFCFLYDRPSLPELLESLLDYGVDPREAKAGDLTTDHTREIARGLIGRAFQEI